MKKVVIKLVGFVFFIVFVLLSRRFFDWAFLKEQILTILDKPFYLLAMTIGYGLAFGFRALAWQRYLNKDISFSLYLYALFYSLLANHLLPIKAGDAVRVGYLAKKGKMTWDEVLNSVIFVRIVDIVILGFIAGVGTVLLGIPVTLRWSVLVTILFILFVVLLLCIFTGIRKFYYLGKHLKIIKTAFAGTNGIIIFAQSLISWLLEASVIFFLTMALSLDVSIFDGVWANSTTIIGQIFHFTPGGIGTYESIMGFTLVKVGVSWQDAYSAAILSHGFKFLFSYLVGLWVFLVSPYKISLPKW